MKCESVSHPVLHKLAWAIFGVVSKVDWLALSCLNVFGFILRNTPDFRLKQNLKNALLSYPWPQESDFPKRRVELSEGCEIEIRPHIGEFDFAALFSRRLNYEREVFSALKARIGQYDSIVEIGANVGVYTLFFATMRRADSVPVFCFEPSMKALGRLVDNLGERHRNIHVIPAAVSDQPGLMPLFEPVGHLTNGSLKKEFATIFSTAVQSNLVPVVDGASLQQLLTHHDHILIKIDVEGAEEEVLQSLRGLLRSKRPDLILEVLEPYEQRLNDLGELLDGYVFYMITPSGLLQKSCFEADPVSRDYLLVFGPR